MAVHRMLTVSLLSATGSFLPFPFHSPICSYTLSNQVARCHSDAVTRNQWLNSIIAWMHRIMYLVWPTNIACESPGYALEQSIHALAIVERWVEGHASDAADAGRPIVVGKVEQLGSNQVAREGLIIILDGKQIVRTVPDMEVIYVDPPDPYRLQYLLPCQTNVGLSISETDLEIQEGYCGNRADRRDAVTVDYLLERVNDLRNEQRAVQGHLIQTYWLSALACQQLLACSAFALLPCALALRAVTGVAEQRFSVFGSTGRRLSDCSATLKQLSLRAAQILDGPTQFRQTLHSDDIPLHVRSRRYMRFWNTVWLIINDLLLGFCAYEILTQNSRFFATHLPFAFKHHLADDVMSALKWLNDWPVGLKLNTPLSEFYSHTFRSFIRSWRDVIIPATRTASPILISILSYASLGGLTLLFAVLQDVLVLSTLHLRFCDRITRGICKWQLESLSGLWNLFRGKRWNVLRQRTDSYQYDVDQLFLGTLLFTVSAFLFPTVLSYAGLFYGIFIAAWTAAYVLKTAQTALNSFPLFEVLLRIKEPSRLPAGIHFVLHHDKHATKQPYLELRNSPKSLASIFSGLISGQT